MRHIEYTLASMLAFVAFVSGVFFAAAVIGGVWVTHSRDPLLGAGLWVVLPSAVASGLWRLASRGSRA